MSMLQLLLWLALAGLLFWLMGLALRRQFQAEEEKRKERESKRFSEWFASLPSRESPDYEKVREEREKELPNQFVEERKAKRWAWIRGIFAYVAVIAVIWMVAVWIPGNQRDQYNEGWFATGDTFDEGWGDGCEFLMATSNGYTWYYGDKEYNTEWCLGLNAVPDVPDFWWDYRPQNLGENATIDDYKRMARTAGWWMAIRTAFNAQPVLCYGDDCWDWDRMDSHIFDIAMEERAMMEGW